MKRPDRTPTKQPSEALSCTSCGQGVESCAFCERDDCGRTICYRCLRIQLKQSMAQPHVHGG
jgi:hypothetical protein